MTALTHKIAQKEFFDDHINQREGSLDLDPRLQNFRMSPEYANMQEKSSKGGGGSRKRQTEAMNIKKTQSMKRMLLEGHEPTVEAMSPSSHAAIQMHNSIALLNQSNSGGRQSQLVNSAHVVDQSIMQYY